MGRKQVHFVTPELVETICSQLAEGKSLRSICKAEGMPSAGTVCQMLARDADFAKQYARAREIQADTIFDEILDIADDSSNDWVETEQGERFNQEAAARARIRIDARKWMAGKLRPKVYGEKVEVGGEFEHKHTHEHRAVSAIDSRIAELSGIREAGDHETAVPD